MYIYTNLIYYCRKYNSTYLFFYLLTHCGTKLKVAVNTGNTKWSHSHCDIKSCFIFISYVAITCSLTVPFCYFHWLLVIHSCFSKLRNFVVSLAVLWYETSSASKDRYRLRTFNKEDPEEYICTWKNRNEGRLGVNYRWTFLPPTLKYKMQWDLQNGYFTNR
jgi:hypothetical protein